MDPKEGRNAGMLSPDPSDARGTLGSHRGRGRGRWGAWQGRGQFLPRPPCRCRARRSQWERGPSADPRRLPRCAPAAPQSGRHRAPALLPVSWRRAAGTEGPVHLSIHPSIHQSVRPSIAPRIPARWDRGGSSGCAAPRDNRGSARPAVSASAGLEGGSGGCGSAAGARAPLRAAGMRAAMRRCAVRPAERAKFAVADAPPVPPGGVPAGCGVSVAPHRAGTAPGLRPPRTSGAAGFRLQHRSPPPPPLCRVLRCSPGRFAVNRGFWGGLAGAGGRRRARGRRCGSAARVPHLHANGSGSRQMSCLIHSPGGMRGDKEPSV